MIDDQSIETLKQRLDIVDVVGHYIELKKSGSGFKCVCPFHDDTNPSMNVSPSRQIFHCFSCGAGGDAIKFVMDYEKLNYPETIEKLATMYNFSLTYIETGGTKKEDKKVLENLNLYYQKCLDKMPSATTYLRERGIYESSIEKFEIGYAPPSQYSLNFMQDKGFTIQDAQEVGVADIGEGGRAYARFIDRITFPIHSSSGKIVGFGGRTITGHPAKYVNSPQSSVFNKSRLLYGYHLARESIMKTGAIIVTEGYMDVVMLHQAGFTNAVATLGTALTAEHVPLITRGNPRVILSYDGDHAGIAAALKASRLLSSHGIEGGVVLFGGGMDPADMVQKGQSEALQRLFDNPQSFIEFCLERIVKNYAIRNPLEKQKALDEATAYLKVLPSAIASAYQGMLADMLGLKDTQVRVASHKPKYQERPREREFVDTQELSIIRTLLIEPNFIDTVLDIIDVSMFKTHGEEFSYLLDNRRDHPSLRRLLLVDSIEILDEKKLIKALTDITALHYKEELSRIKTSRHIDYHQKVFLMNKIKNILLKLEKGELVPYESFSTI